MKFISNPLPFWAKFIFLIVWMTTLIIPWHLSFSWSIKTIIFIAALSYGAFIALRDVWRCLPFSISALHRCGNDEWLVELFDGSHYSARVAGDSVVSASIIFLRLNPDALVPFYFPKTVLMFSIQNHEAHRLCLLALNAR